MTELTKEDLISFEKEIEELYLDGKIRSPVHFSGGNEDQLIEIFKNIKEDDWVFSTYRSHYHALLKGIPKEELIKKILENKSIHIMDKKYKFVTSSIVAGALPIAVGTAMALKLNGSKDRVWVFCGDMAAETGIFYECTKYARRHDLPITFIVEDNGLSVDTPTQEVWGEKDSGNNIIKFQYKRLYPHYGSGEWVDFK